MTHLYLETSVFGFYYDKLKVNQQKKQITRMLFEQIGNGLFDASISPVVAAELNKATDSHLKNRILSLIDNFNIMNLKVRAEKQGDLQIIVTELIERKVIPVTKKDDAAHIALVTINPQIDFLVTWNCVHLANVNIFRKARAVILSLGYEIKFEIVTPEEVIKYEER